MDAYEAYWFLYNHPKSIDVHPDHVFPEHAIAWEWEGQFIHNLNIMYVKVNPRTIKIDPNESLNTKIQVWLETGPAQWGGEYLPEYISNVHDYQLDVGADTFEEALILLAQKVKDKYGDYSPDKDE